MPWRKILRLLRELSVSVGAVSDGECLPRPAVSSWRDGAVKEEKESLCNDKAYCAFFGCGVPAIRTGVPSLFLPLFAYLFRLCQTSTGYVWFCQGIVDGSKAHHALPSIFLQIRLRPFAVRSWDDSACWLHARYINVKKGQAWTNE